MIPKIIPNHLPFVPRYGQVIYIPSGSNKRIDEYVSYHFAELLRTYSYRDLEFCKLPLFLDGSLAYFAPHLTATERQVKSYKLYQYYCAISPDVPILLFSPTGESELAVADPTVYAVEIHAKWHQSLMNIFKNLADVIHYELATIHKPSPLTLDDLEFDESPISVCQEPEEHYGDIRFRIRDDDKELLDAHSQLLVDEIMQRVTELRSRGVSTDFLHDIIDDDEPLSRLRITKDYHIFLPDFENLEIKMPPLLKAVFLLYLRHPEGIRLKALVDHHDELLRIYRSLQPIGSSARQEQSIRDLTDPLSNSINEKIAQIRKTFVSHFDASLACNYYITGKRGEAKRITLDASLVIWE